MNYKKVVPIILCFILCIVILVKCQASPTEDYSKNIDVIQGYGDTRTSFYTYEEISQTYKINEIREKELLSQTLELFLSADPAELCNEAYAIYFGNLGRAFVREYVHFKTITYIGEGKNEIPQRVEEYRTFFNNNLKYNRLGNLLLKIEKDLKSGHYETALESFQAAHKVMKELVGEGEAGV